MNGSFARERARWLFDLPALNSTAVLAGLGLLFAAIALALVGKTGVYVDAAAIALVIFYVILRHPTAITYVTLGWLMFEKSLGTYDGKLSATFSTLGDALLVFALFWVIVLNLMRRRSPVLQFRQIGLGLAAFVLFGIASTVANDVQLHVAELGILDTLRSLIIFLVVVNIGISAKDVHTFVYWVIGVMAVSAFVGILQISPHSPAWVLGGERFAGSHGLMRVDGLFDHPLSLGDYLALTTPLAISLVAFGNVTGKWKRWLVGGTLCMVVALFLTLAREAWIAVPASLIVVGLLVDRKILKTVVPPIAILALIAAPFASSVNSTDTGSQRFTLFRLTLPLIKSHLLLGAGPGRYGGHVAAITHTPLYAEYHVSGYFYGTGNQIDQFWTHLLAEFGILGVAAFVSMMVASFVIGRGAYLASTDPTRKAILLGLLCAIPSAVILSFVSSTLEEGPAATLFWALMGMLTVLSLANVPAVAESPPSVVPVEARGPLAISASDS